MAQVALGRGDDRHLALRSAMTELLSMDQPRKHTAGMLSGLDIRYDLGADDDPDRHPLLGRRMPDLDLHTDRRPTRVYELLHDAQPVLLDLGPAAGSRKSPWADRVNVVDATCTGTWELPVIGEVTAPRTVLIRPDGHVAWTGDHDDSDALAAAMTTWFATPTASRREFGGELRVRSRWSCRASWGPRQAGWSMGCSELATCR